MLDAVRQQLARDPTIDITTTGRRSGAARRIEIWMMVVDDRFFITGGTIGGTVLALSAAAVALPGPL